MKALLKNFAGVIVKDLPRYALRLWGGRQKYLLVRNRTESLERAPDGSGFRCKWRWTSDLHAPKIVPALGRSLMRHALADHPVERTPESPCSVAGQKPQITFLVGHRGEARVPHLLATLQSIAAQKGAAVECIVIEQESESRLRLHLPQWVRLIHTPPPDTGMPYCRSWSFNIGAQHARSPVLVLHDNDMLVPVDYAAHVLKRVAQGYDVVTLTRFVFYLTPWHSQAIFDGLGDLLADAPEVIVQNLEGGGSVGITLDGYDRIGGMDESFVGWGGEDNEFWERAKTLRVWDWANLPMLHLWHAAQTGKRDAQFHTAQHYRDLSQVDPHVRVAHLSARASGQLRGPTGWPLATGNGRLGLTV